MTISRAGKTAVINMAEAASLLDAMSSTAELSARLDAASRAFLGKPYAEDPLIGGPETPEVLTISLSAFDCVTYIETVLGLALSRSERALVRTIRAMRYEGGAVQWQHRNHFMVDWARNNEKAGIVEDLTKGPLTVERTRSLSSIP